MQIEAAARLKSTLSDLSALEISRSISFGAPPAHISNWRSTPLFNNIIFVDNLFHHPYLLSNFFCALWIIVRFASNSSTPLFNNIIFLDNLYHHLYLLHNYYLLPDFFCALMKFPLGSYNLLSHVYTQAFCSLPSFRSHVFRCVFYSTFFHISTPKGALQIRSVARRKIAGRSVARKVHCKALALEAGSYKKSKRLSWRIEAKEFRDICFVDYIVVHMRCRPDACKQFFL